MKSFQNSELLSKRTRLDVGCLFNKVYLKSLEIRTGVLSTLGTSTISNHPVLGSINVMAVNDDIIGIPLVSSVQGPMRSTYTSAHGVASATLTGNLPYLGLFFAYFFFKIAHLLTR